MPTPDPNTRAHLEWLGFIQPNGLVVSAPALVKAGAILNRQDAEGQSRLLGCVDERVLDPARGPEPCLPDFGAFAADVLGWGFSPRGYAGTRENPIPAELEVPLPGYGVTLRPDFAVRERDPRDGEPPWQLLVQVLEAGQSFDGPVTTGGAGSRLDASPQSRAERLLRGTGVPAGLLFNGAALRLISAPRGESSGWMDFRVADMSLTAGRPLCSALRLLLSEQRLLALPERHGGLFDPDRYPFLEGRHETAGARQTVGRVHPPLISDGAVYRVLEKLLVLDGERISYRTLDVEQIGSVYETIMGFRMEVATGRSIAIKPAKKLGAPSTVDLDALLEQASGGRARWLQAHADRNLTDTVARGLRAAETVEDLHAALDRVLDKDATPDLVPAGALVLQPNEERRRSGSHYTPRELTEPIVRHTLAPILKRLRGEDDRPPAPTQILDLKVCDPAMGSGAFLVETCRQLADALIDAWGAHGEMPAIPPDEDEVTFARRLVAQRCLYGIDRNPMAVDLAKVSLWLSTLARDHSLTFVDHAFRHGDSLVGLTRRQIEAFHWLPNARPLQTGIEAGWILEHVAKVAELRRRIREAGEEVSDQERHDLWHDARSEIDAVRLYGDLALAAFFAEAKPSSTPTDARTSPPTATSSSTTKSTRPLGVGRKSRSATAGRTASGTRCSPASSPSTPNAPPRKPAPARRATRPVAVLRRSPHAPDTDRPLHPAPASWSRSPNPLGPPPMTDLNTRRADPSASAWTSPGQRVLSRKLARKTCALWLRKRLEAFR